MQSKTVSMVVIDAGGRYGLHPTWKRYDGELDYYLFEPDLQEANRLIQKYKKRTAEVRVEAMALGAKSGDLKINILRNKAMSTSTVRNPVSALFTGERRQEVDTVDVINVPMVTIDEYADENNLNVDFLKLDTEGSEYEILNGSTKQLERNILGVRSEVAFDHIFQGKEIFSDIHALMLQKGFFLLNLDYLGQGDYQREEVAASGRFGILTACDAVWLRRFESFLDQKGAEKDAILKVLKVAAFCFHNFAPDVALKLLLDARRIYHYSFKEFSQSKLYGGLDNLVHRHFYRLKWQPGQSLKNNQKIYFDIFEKEMKVMNEYMESLELNPE